MVPAKMPLLSSMVPVLRTACPTLGSKIPLNSSGSNAGELKNAQLSRHFESPLKPSGFA